MNILFEMAKIILPAIITGLFTFYITKYSYDKSVPLDKLEISYNRVYYPISKMFSLYKIDDIIEKTKIYFKKYDKYVDKSTKEIFSQLCESSKKKQIFVYLKFTENIENRITYMRRRLGYLEPNLILRYKYSNPNIKYCYRCIVELCIFCIFIIIYGLSVNRNNIIAIVSMIIFSVFFIIFILEILCAFVRNIIYQIIKFIKWLQ